MMETDLTKRIIKTLKWMVEDMVWRFEQEGIEGNYSPELQEAINLLAFLEEGNDDIKP